MNQSNRAVWQEKDVVDVRDSAFAARTYCEQADVRSFIATAAQHCNIRAACEIGAGYGRMTVVLRELCDQVIGFEREPRFVESASALIPGIRFVQVESLSQLPCKDESFDFVLTFTVLQHLTDLVAESTSAEIARVVRCGGYLLCCEETDPLHCSGNVDDPNSICTVGRPIAIYQRLFSGFELCETRSRRIEPTYSRPDVGAYMFFQKK